MALMTVHISVTYQTTCRLTLVYSNLVTTKQITSWSLASPSCPSIHLPTHTSHNAAKQQNVQPALLYFSWHVPEVTKDNHNISYIPSHFQSEIYMGIIKYQTDVLIDEP